MKQNVIGFIFSFFLFSLSLAQERSPILVKAKVEDLQGFALEYAAIKFTSLRNPKQVFGDLTNDRGEFSVKLTPGKYQLSITAIGYEEFRKDILIKKNPNLGTFTLKNTTEVEIDEVLIQAEKPLYKIELDKKVYDLENDPAAKGLSLSNALENVPSVQVGADGVVSLRGNANVTILVNGKPSSLVGITSSADALQNIPAESVKRVEVITSPSARYEASGTAGIINIVLKKGSRKGFNGSITTNIGDPERAGINASLNYKLNNWNFFTNSGFRYAKNIGGSEFNNFLLNDAQNITRTETQTGSRRRIQRNYTFQLGAQYDWNEKNNILGSTRYNFSSGDNVRDLFYQNFTGVFDSFLESSNRIEDEDENDSNFEINLSYQHLFTKEGHELTTDFNFSRGIENELANITERILFSGNDFLNQQSEFDRSRNNEEQNQYLFQTDYLLPIKENARFEFGIRNAIRNNKNNFTVEELNFDTNKFETLNNFTDDTEYRENIFAIYSQYGNKQNQFSYLAGLRIEKSGISVESNKAQSRENQNYTDFFPTLNLNYEFSPKHEVQLSYSRRIRRPRSRFLIPFFSFSDDRNTFIGNINLQPTYRNLYEATYIGRLGKLTITPSLYFNYSQNPIQIFRSLRFFDTNGTLFGEIPEGENQTNFLEIFVAQPINVGTDSRYGLDLNLLYKPKKWWRFSTNLNLFYFDLNGTHLDTITDKEISFNGNDFNWFLFVNNTFTLPAKINFQTTFNYFGRQENARSIRKSIYSLNFALSKDILKNNGTITFNLRDLLNSRRRNIESFDTNFRSDIEFYRSVRTVNLSFTYRFNQKKKRERKENRNSGEDIGF